jgi:hypothetical protein
MESENPRALARYVSLAFLVSCPKVYPRCVAFVRSSFPVDMVWYPAFWSAEKYVGTSFAL